MLQKVGRRSREGLVAHPTYNPQTQPTHNPWATSSQGFLNTCHRLLRALLTTLPVLPLAVMCTGARCGPRAARASVTRSSAHSLLCNYWCGLTDSRRPRITTTRGWKKFKANAIQRARTAGRQASLVSHSSCKWFSCCFTAPFYLHSRLRARLRALLLATFKVTKIKVESPGALNPWVAAGGREAISIS